HQSKFPVVSLGVRHSPARASFQPVAFPRNSSTVTPPRTSATSLKLPSRSHATSSCSLAHPLPHPSRQAQHKGFPILHTPTAPPPFYPFHKPLVYIHSYPANTFPLNARRWHDAVQHRDGPLKPVHHHHPHHHPAQTTPPLHCAQT
ncbi:unnamed protein product, partial [Pleuronectes platessa]